MSRWSSRALEKRARRNIPRNTTHHERGHAAKRQRDNALPRAGGGKSRQPVYSTQEDPIGLSGGMNLYGYAAGDPVNNSDPFGLCPPEDDEDCSFVQRAANWAAANGHNKTLNTIAAVDAVLVTLAETVQPGDVGPAAAAGGMLFRFGTRAESASELGAAAARAQANGFGHGVSVTTMRPTRTPASAAAREAVEEYFTVNRTGNSPGHHTVILPQPVTTESASLFNRLFGRTP